MEPMGGSLAYPPAICFNPPGGFGAFGTVIHVIDGNSYRHVSIRRADLGLLELLKARPGETVDQVSIRRADLGLLEQRGAIVWSRITKQFQSAGRIWGFWNHTICSVDVSTT